MVSEEKKKTVKEVSGLVEKYPVVGLVNMHKLPARQLGEIKEKLRGKAVIRVTKKSLMKLALENSKAKSLLPSLEGQPAFLFSESDPFELARILNASKSPAPAKPGDIAPRDLVIPAGPTSLMAGPAIGELQKVGIPAAIESGKIAIKKETTVAKKGDKISKDLAAALSKLGVEPMEIGLDLVSLLDKGLIYNKYILFKTQEHYTAELVAGYRDGLNLSVNIKYYTKENLPLVISKAHLEAEALGSFTKQTQLKNQGTQPQETPKS